MKDRLFIALQYLVPHHLLSRLVGLLAASRIRWLKNTLIRSFIRVYGVDMSQAQHREADDYPSFNAFFTRALKPDARPLAAEPAVVLCPADGTVSAIGQIHDDRIFQAKGHDFSLTTLLGGDPVRAQPFRHGSFATIYLAPKDYHRVHCPLAGTLREMIYVPGKLFSVNQTTAEAIPGLFARNERAVCLFDTAHGPMAVVLVGAMIVAAIDTVWAGRVAPAPHDLQVTDYRRHTPPVQLAAGAELGRFSLGSTAIVLFGPDCVNWRDELGTCSDVRMGEALGRLR